MKVILGIISLTSFFGVAYFGTKAFIMYAKNITNEGVLLSKIKSEDEKKRFKRYFWGLVAFYLIPRILFKIINS